MTDARQLLILGVSARAAAFSAIRSEYVPLAADCFRDEDLIAACDCRRIDCYPTGLEAIAAGFPDCPWLYTGGLENHPRLVGRIEKRRQLLGNPEKVLRRVRDPLSLAEALRHGGLPCLDVSATPPDSAHGEWLQKPLKSGGGRGIEFVSGTTPDRLQPGGRVYYQRYVAGTACSAVFVAAEGRAVWLGSTQQLIGTAWTGAKGFEYAGSIGPLDVPARERTRWQAIGNGLADRFELSGLFGVDAVMTDDAIWVVEVNPRYTASVEVLELACGASLVRLHVRACQRGELPREWPVRPGRRVGKAVVYAEKDGRVPANFGQFVRNVNLHPTRPAVADIPAGGRAFRRGEPLVTVLAEGRSLREVEETLRQKVGLAQAALACV